MWKLAETHLGDGGRWQEILDLNRGAAMSDGIPLTQATQTLPAGSTLRLPAKAAPHPHTETTPDELYTVAPNDTLWDIADETLDDPTRYTEVFAASTDTVQPGGQRLVDPDHIEPGWTLTIPDTDPPSEGRPTSTPPGTATRLRTEPARRLAPSPSAGRRRAVAGAAPPGTTGCDPDPGRHARRRASRDAAGGGRHDVRHGDRARRSGRDHGPPGTPRVGRMPLRRCPDHADGQSPAPVP